ncbi:MAG: hypothetical protein K8R75_06545 [Deltaproteobacteria bacterium]|nr:hypothetical protein [Deltaproteobacteria bacterium]
MGTKPFPASSAPYTAQCTVPPLQADAVLVHAPVGAGGVTIMACSRTKLYPADVLSPGVTGETRVVDRDPAIVWPEVLPSGILRLHHSAIKSMYCL